MIRRIAAAGGITLVVGMAVLAAQTTRVVPRPPALPPGQQPPGESAAPDGYAPIPQWLGQTRAPVPAKTASFDVQTVAEGLNGLTFQFLPDGRIVVGERTGRIRIVGKDGKVSEPLEGMPANMVKSGGQILYDVQLDRRFASNRTIYLDVHRAAGRRGCDEAAQPHASACRKRAGSRLTIDVSTT